MPLTHNRATPASRPAKETARAMDGNPAGRPVFRRRPAGSGRASRPRALPARPGTRRRWRGRHGRAGRQQPAGPISTPRSCRGARPRANRVMTALRALGSRWGVADHRDHRAARRPAQGPAPPACRPGLPPAGHLDDAAHGAAMAPGPRARLADGDVRWRIPCRPADPRSPAGSVSVPGVPLTRQRARPPPAVRADAIHRRPPFGRRKIGRDPGQGFRARGAPRGSPGPAPRAGLRRRGAARELGDPRPPPPPALAAGSSPAVTAGGRARPGPRG